MSPSRIVQPLVCCLGNPVAGNPTQFIMMRAARAAGIEWRFLTAEVAADRLETAFRGVQALGFDGVSLMPPFQQSVIPLLDSVTGSALTLGSVNVARVDGNSWLGDNTFGLGIARCLEAYAESGSPSVGVTATDSEVGNETPSEPLTANSFNGAAVVGFAPALAQVLKMTAWPWSQSVQLFREESTSDSDDETKAATAEITSDDRTGTPIKFLIFDKTPPQEYHKLLMGLKWCKKAACIVVDPGQDRVTRSFREMLLKNEIDWIGSTTLRAHCYAADFQFWTGVEPSITLIEDSLEEYDEW
jgi:shikimate dehydrogenase